MPPSTRLRRLADHDVLHDQRGEAMTSATQSVELPRALSRPGRYIGVRHGTAVAVVLVSGGIVFGAALVLLAYQLAKTAQGTGAYPVFFFAGITLMFAPITLYCLSGTRPQRELAVVIAGAASYVPDFLREPNRVYLGDEFAHLQQATTMYRTGHLFAANQLVPEAGKYPGFEMVVDTIREMTGLSTYRAGTILILLCHVIAVVGVYEIARGITTGRWAAVAAIAFAISPQLVAFDSLFSYETLGLPLFTSGLAVACRATREPALRTRRVLLGCAGIITIFAIVTHHVSSFALLAGLLVVALGWLTFPERGVGRSDAFLLLLIVAVGAVTALVWALVVRAHLGAYLLTEPENGIRTLYDRLSGAQDGIQRSAGYQPLTVVRSPLSGSGKPVYELGIAELTPLAALALVAAAVWSRRRHWTPTWLLLCALALSYALLLPFLFAASAQTIVHRSWAFNYLGLACLGTVGAQVVVEHLAAWRSKRLQKLSAARLLVPPLAAVAIPLLLAISAYGVGPSVISTYPGPLLLESDGRDTPPEAFDLAGWFSSHVGRGKVVLTDDRTGEVLAGIADEKLDPALAVQLILASGPISGPLRREVQRQAAFVVLDSTLWSQVSSAGFYISQYEPFVPEPLPTSYFTRLSSAPWLKVVHRTPNYTVLKVTA
jgi:hypothetical protein